MRQSRIPQGLASVRKVGASAALRSAGFLSLLAVLLGAAAACGDAAAGADAGFAVRDSAGVTIVENAGHAWEAGEEWRLAASPEVDIGAVDGDPRYQLFRVYGGTVLPDRRIAIVNSGTSEVRIYDAAGGFLLALGREGEGPGEFRRVAQIWPYRGDSLLVADPGLLRATVISSDGSIARQMRLATTPSNPSFLRPLDDGSVILVDERFNLSNPGVQQQEMELVRHNPLGAYLDSLGALPFMETVVVGSGGGMMVGSPIFAAHTALAVAGDSLFVATARAAEVEVRSSDGTVIRRIRWPESDRKVAAADVDRYRQDRLEGMEDANERRQREQYLAALPHEELFPAYQGIQTDRAGNLWIEQFRRPADEGPRRWLVLDAAGRTLGEVATPWGLRVVEIGVDYVLGVERDELDIEHVRLYGLVKE